MDTCVICSEKIRDMRIKVFHDVACSLNCADEYSLVYEEPFKSSNGFSFTWLNPPAAHRGQTSKSAELK